jgi:hypothetical protein
VSTPSPDLDIRAANDSSGGSAGSGTVAAGLGVADWLSLAAAPTFAFMALLAALGGGPDVLCSAGHGTSPLTGMVAMYLLMSAVHLTPWLKLVSSRRGAARQR